MYCSTCGTEQPQELSYCNRCGANLRPLAMPAVESVIRHKSIAGLMVVATTFITLGGFFAVLFIFMAYITRGIGLDDSAGLLIAAVLAATVGIDLMLLRMVSRLLDLRGTSAKEVAVLPKPLAEPTRRYLDEPRIPAASVTDHTTRTLPPVYVDRPETKEI